MFPNSQSMAVKVFFLFLLRVSFFPTDVFGNYSLPFVHVADICTWAHCCHHTNNNVDTNINNNIIIIHISTST